MFLHFHYCISVSRSEDEKGPAIKPEREKAHTLPFFLFFLLIILSIAPTYPAVIEKSL